MKSLQLLLSLYAISALSKDSISPLPDLGECKLPTSQWVGALEESKAVSSEPYDASPVSSAFPIASPCARNGTTSYCVYSDPSFADHRGISFLTTSTQAQRLARSSIFRKPSLHADVPDLNAASSPRWAVRAVPGKGMGLFATQRLELGDRVMSATPSIMIDYSVYESLGPGAIHELQAAAIGALPAAHRAAFMELSTHDGAASHIERVEKIMLTNAFDLAEAGDDQEEEEEGPNWFTVFPHISRLNHDCRPNADYYFDPVTLTQNIHATRSILPGEEITVSYINTLQPREARRERIERTWHFLCACSLCTAPRHQTAASDARIAQIAELTAHLRDSSSSSASSSPSPQMAELLVSLYEQERLWGSIHEAYAQAAVAYSAVGEAWMAVKYARLAVQRGLAAKGPRDGEVGDMEGLAEDPGGHWSWGIRMPGAAEEEGGVVGE
ncbi:hypothetical protein F5Y15DRAFT_425587 [Xylariaceae sp. FL0016]|nr:hypothetical protein F5Y15DRAFT_425587 [Xylariaceae sp. FL0016]